MAFNSDYSYNYGIATGGGLNIFLDQDAETNVNSNGYSLAGTDGPAHTPSMHGIAAPASAEPNISIGVDAQEDPSFWGIFNFS